MRREVSIMSIWGLRGGGWEDYSCKGYMTCRGCWCFLVNGAGVISYWERAGERCDELFFCV